MKQGSLGFSLQIPKEKNYRRDGLKFPNDPPIPFAGGSQLNRIVLIVGFIVFGASLAWSQIGTFTVKVSTTDPTVIEVPDDFVFGIWKQGIICSTETVVCPGCPVCPVCPPPEPPIIIQAPAFSTGAVIMQAVETKDCFKCDRVFPNGTIQTYPCQWTPCPKPDASKTLQPIGPDAAPPR